MQFYWVKDRVKRKQFLVYWRQGVKNDADYFTKRHPTSHHRRNRSRFLHISFDTDETEANLQIIIEPTRDSSNDKRVRNK